MNECPFCGTKLPKYIEKCPDCSIPIDWPKEDNEKILRIDEEGIRTPTEVDEK